MIRVLIFDHLDQVRRGLRMRLSIEPDLTVVGETGKIEEALYLAQAHKPDVIILGMEARDDEGGTLVKHLRAAAPKAAMVALTLHGNNGTRARAQEAGVQAFLEKNGGGGDLLDVIRQLVGKASAERGLNLERNSDPSV